MISKEFPIADSKEMLLILGPQDIYLKEMEKDFDVDIYIKHNSINDGATLVIKGKLKNVDKAINHLNRIINRYYSELNQSKSTPQIQIKTNEQSIVYKTEYGETIKPKTKNQEIYIKTMRDSDIVIAIGPAGTGKTFLATSVALKFLQEKLIKKIVVTRPIIEVGERLGFLPGDIESKVNPYLKPVYDNFYSMLGPERFQIYRDEEIIETIPLAYMRGRTLDNSFIILDEAQNTTTTQMKMFLTRMGHNSKMVITGDITQIDIKEKNTSGLITLLEVIKDIEEIKVIRFTNDDIVRHPLVSKIVNAYEKWEQNGNKYNQ